MGHNRKIIYGAGFLFSLSIALISYINSSYLILFVGEKFMSIVFAIGSAASILSLVVAPRVWRKVGGYKFLLSIILLNALSSLALALIGGPWSATIIFILALSLNALVIFSLDELLKIFSKDSATGKIRGIYITICNLSWILAQFAFWAILGEFPFKTIYFISFAIMILFFILCFRNLKNVSDPNYDNFKILKYLKKFFQIKNLSRAYGMTFLLQIFYCWMVIYTPIYLYMHLGFSWREIGIIFAVMLLPFAFIPPYAGRRADKIGERKMLMLGFLIASLFTLSLFFIHGRNIFVWILFLFATRVGASTVETTSDTYFFKHIKPENEEFVGIYRSASPVAYVLGPLSAFALFMLVPSFNYIYPVLGAIMLFGVYLASTIRKGDI